MRQEDIEIAETGAVRGLEIAAGMGTARKETRAEPQRQYSRAGRGHEAAPAQVHRLQIGQVRASHSLTHGNSPLSRRVGSGQERDGSSKRALLGATGLRRTHQGREGKMGWARR